MKISQRLPWILVLAVVAIIAIAAIAAAPLAAVPEPSSLVIFGVATMGAAIFHRLRRARTKRRVAEDRKDDPCS